MGSLGFEGRDVEIRQGDTVASALYRSGVRTFSRSLKNHRRRGLYCGTGDCPNCLVAVDGQPAVRSCCTPAVEGMRVEREGGWPSTEFDLLSVTDRLHPLMPVGFYYKTFIHPRFAWRIAEKLIRKATGLGRLPAPGDRSVSGVRPSSRHLHTDVLVIGAGPAGLSAAAAAAGRGERVVLAEEHTIGASIAPGPTRDLVAELETMVRGMDGVTILERHAAVGAYLGPMVPLASTDALLQVHPRRVIVATGAVEGHAVFDGNDVPGVWQGRGAARLAGVHGLAPGSRAVVWVTTEEGLAHVRTLLDRGVEITAAVAPAALIEHLPAGIGRRIADGEIVATDGRSRVRAAIVRVAGARERIECDAIVCSVGFTPRDDLLRMGADSEVSGAGDVLQPGCTLQDAVESGRLAATGEEGAEASPVTPSMGQDGVVCLCEDVGVKDLDLAWEEGYRSSEILKRYTTATMGPCQGAMCGVHLACFVAERAGDDPAVRPQPSRAARTTARPPARAVSLAVLASGVHEVAEKRTALHERHLQMGASLDWSGSWKRPFNYGDWRAEYEAVRERVSVMDVSTLGKFLIGGPDARALVDHVFPARVHDLTPGRARYLLALGEDGYVVDDGLIAALGDDEPGSYYLTSTSGGSDGMEASLRNWADRLGLAAHVMNRTAMLGTVVVAGPHSRDLLEALTGDAIDAEAIAYMGHARVSIAGIPCRAIRVGFTGELAFELHHPRSRSVELWDALITAGAAFELRPHGLDALELLRLEKGHIYLLQDTLPDDTPDKLGLSWAVDRDKTAFVGKVALERMAALPLERRLLGLAFATDQEASGLRGVPLTYDGHVIGRVTSAATSPACAGAGIGMGWVRAVDGGFPRELMAGSVPARVVATPFYDPSGERLRA